MFDRQPVIDQLAQRVDADAQVLIHKILGHLLITFGSFDAFGRHWLVGNQQQRAGGDFVEKTGAENRGGFHVNRHRADAAQVFLEGLIVFPDAPVGGVDGAGPVITPVVADGGGNGFLQAEGRHTTDPDPGNTFTYSLVENATYPDNIAFQISGNTLKTNAVFDFETKAAYTIKVQTNDGRGGVLAKEFTISVMDVNDSSVTISGNAGIAGAILGYTDGAPKTVTADTNGDYSITIPYNWSGTVTPAKANYTFLPESRAYTNLTANPGGENYTATPITYTAAISSSGAYDGWILESGETSNKGSSLDATASTFRLGDDALNRQYRSILSFNTSSLPDGAVITSVTLKFRKNPVAGVSLISKFGGLVVEVKKGYFGASAKLQAGDFQARASKAFGPFKPIPANGWVTINLNSAAFPYINKSSAYQSGHTQLRLGYKLDDNNNNIANFMSFSSGNALSSQPQLIITYIIP